MLVQKNNPQLEKRQLVLSPTLKKSLCCVSVVSGECVFEYKNLLAYKVCQNRSVDIQWSEFEDGKEKDTTHPLTTSATDNFYDDPTKRYVDQFTHNSHDEFQIHSLAFRRTYFCSRVAWS